MNNPSSGLHPSFTLIAPVSGLMIAPQPLIHQKLHADGGMSL
jgi:hypothetical protein